MTVVKPRRELHRNTLPPPSKKTKGSRKRLLVDIPNPNVGKERFEEISESSNTAGPSNEMVSSSDAFLADYDCSSNTHEEKCEGCTTKNVPVHSLITNVNKLTTQTRKKATLSRTHAFLAKHSNFSHFIYIDEKVSFGRCCPFPLIIIKQNADRYHCLGF